MRDLTRLLLLLTALASVACGGSGRTMRERPPSAATRATSGPSPRAQAQGQVSPYVSSVASPSNDVDLEPVTPKAYAAAVPEKPQIVGLTETELGRCEAELPALDSCKPGRSLAEGGEATLTEVRACVARYVAALDGCLCRSGSKPHCQFAEDQRRELEQMKSPSP